MLRDPKVVLQDLLRFSIELESLGSEYPDASTFISDRKGVLASERLIEMVGECIARLKRMEFEFTHIDTKPIVGMRNRLAHEYDRIDPAITFAVLKFHATPLRESVEMEIEALASS